MDLWKMNKILNIKKILNISPDLTHGLHASGEMEGGKGWMTKGEKGRKNSTWIPRTNRNQIRRKRIIDNGRHICT
jgi:hypothetical protein